jgi:hypothetical protein
LPIVRNGTFATVLVGHFCNSISLNPSCGWFKTKLSGSPYLPHFLEVKDNDLTQLARGIVKLRK